MKSRVSEQVRKSGKALIGAGGGSSSIGRAAIIFRNQSSLIRLKTMLSVNGGA